MTRCYVNDLTSGSRTLSADQAHHAIHVLRLGVGDEVTAFDGRGAVATGRISAVSRRDVAIAIEQVLPTSKRSEPLVELAFAIPRGKRVDWLLEKATELGAAVLQPVTFERSIAQDGLGSAAKRQRWLGHCVAAARQCGLDFLPELRPSVSLASYVSTCSAPWRLVGEVDVSGGSLLEALAGWEAGQAVAVLVGPEGDLTDGERQTAAAAGFRAVHLGHTTMRVETAALALTAGVVAICGQATG